MSQPRFNTGQFVRRIRNPDSAGKIVQPIWDDQLEEWTYRVRFGNAARGVPESELELVPMDADPWDEVRNGRVAGAQAFKGLLTYERLRKPPSRIAASFGSAKAAFYPYQFKPLLKFLESPKQRLLLADDVGLGKTIEAGYILREVRARQGLERVMIVVPARLRTKWKTELERRFNEHFETVRRRELLGLLDRLRRGRDPEAFHWIVSYESARGEEVIEALEELRPPLDLVIVDEAHRMRNPPTLQHRLGRALAESADAMLLLTATPVQTGPSNLFSLLNILDPEDFAAERVFEDQLRANRPVVRALRALRVHPVDSAAVTGCLEELKEEPLTRTLCKSDYFNSIMVRARESNLLPRAELVELQRDTYGKPEISRFRPGTLIHERGGLEVWLAA